MSAPKLRFLFALCLLAALWLPVAAQTVSGKISGTVIDASGQVVTGATVTLLNEGGKNVIVDLKHIPQGGSCRVDKDDLIARVGPGAQPGTTRVRSAGMGFSYNFGRALGALFPALVGVLSQHIDLGTAIGAFTIGSYALVLLSLIALPETKGRELIE